MRATQLSDFGTDQSPIMRGQSSNIRIRWNTATKVKITPATVQNVLRFMESRHSEVDWLSVAYYTTELDRFAW
jgi:hypothetical protein